MCDGDPPGIPGHLGHRVEILGLSLNGWLVLCLDCNLKLRLKDPAAVPARVLKKQVDREQERSNLMGPEDDLF